MLVDPILNLSAQGSLHHILGMLGDKNGPLRKERGLYLVNHWNFDSYFFLPVPFSRREGEAARLDRYMALPFEARYPEFPVTVTKVGRGTYTDSAGLVQYEDDEDNYLSTTGVCDSVEQFIEYAAGRLDVPDRFFCVSFVCIERSRQPSEDGWRYHKWGKYIGKQNPQHEYLYEDKHIDQVYTYHIYEFPKGQFYDHTAHDHTAPEAGDELRRCHAFMRADGMVVLNLGGQHA